MNDKSPVIPMPMSGFCQFSTETSHEFCRRTDCTCPCHQHDPLDTK